MTCYRNLLSLDGGGIRGLITALILQEIEERANEPIRELFDLIVGTSTGGILASGLATNSRSSGHGPFSAKDLAKFYRDQGTQIFGDKKFWGPLFGPKYNVDPLEDRLLDQLGDAQLEHTCPDIVITSYDIEERRPYFFKTRKARTNKQLRNHLLRHVARATSAAPTLFEPLLLDKVQWEGENKTRVLIDGGVFASNPAMIALIEARHNGTELNDILLCSIGTGMNNELYSYSKAKGYGYIGWAKRLSYIMMDGMSDSVHYHARDLIPVSQIGSTRPWYHRFDIELRGKASDSMDDTSLENIDRLEKTARAIIRKYDKELDELIQLLCVGKSAL